MSKKLRQPITKAQRKSSRKRNIEAGTVLRQAVQSRGFQGKDLLSRFF